MPRWAATLASITTQADAPSANCEALPAVMYLPWLDLLAAAEHRLQRLEAFQRRVGAIAFVAIDGDVDDALLARRLVELLHLGVERNDLVLELAGLLRGGGAALAFQRIFVLALARDLVALGDDLGGLDHRHPQSSGLTCIRCSSVMFLVFMPPICTSEMDSTPEPIATGAFGHDLLRRHGDGLQAGGAEAVDRGAGGGDRAAGPDRRVARDVHAGGAFGLGAAHEDVFDFGRIDAGVGDGVLDGVAAHHRAMGHVEAAAHGFGEPGARGRNDDGFFHGRFFF